MFAALEELVERRIEEARRQGAFDDLPGSGRPLELDDDRLVPEELRMAYRILKNAGLAPPEVEALRGIDVLLGAALDAADGASAGPHGRRDGRTAEDGGGQGGAEGRGMGGRGTGGRDGAEGRGARRMIALAVALEQRGASLTSGAALAYRRAFIDKLARS